MATSTISKIEQARIAYEEVKAKRDMAAHTLVWLLVVCEIDPDCETIRDNKRECRELFDATTAAWETFYGLWKETQPGA